MDEILSRDILGRFTMRLPMQLQRLTDLVDDYRTHFALHDDLNFYENLPTLETAIDYAALGTRPDGKRHSHQWRLEPFEVEDF